MTASLLSVIIVSRHRARALLRCIRALEQQDTGFELVVVADSDAVRDVVRDYPTAKVQGFDDANISAARNLGLAQAAGEFVAYIDDDAVAEPSWAGRLLRAFDAPEVVAATGYVLGRNGISFQWQGVAIDHAGRDHALADPDAPLPPGTVPKCQGTNMAFRAADLRQIGGFDPALRFYLEDADASLRVAAHGQIKILPDAVVHHGFLASDQRRADRVPRSLFDIGASTAVFLRRYGQNTENLPADLINTQKKRLIAHMIAGRIEPRDVGRLMQSLRDGWADGMGRPLDDLSPLGTTPPPFAPFARSKDPVKTIFDLRLGFARHWHRFGEDGVWVQKGGLWGRSVRNRRAPFFLSRAKRIAIEIERISRYRPI